MLIAKIWLKYVNIGNHRYTNEQNCILLKKSVIKKNFARLRSAKFFLPPPPPPNPKIVPTALINFQYICHIAFWFLENSTTLLPPNE